MTPGNSRSDNAPPPGLSKQHGHRIAVLDGFRALAILSVLAFHYTVRWAPPSDPEAHFPAGAIFNGFIPLEYGWLGVEFFFVISGFVILMTLEHCRSVGDFAVRRFARLWPPLFVAVALTSIIVFLIGPAEWRVSSYDYMASILLVDPRILSGLLHHAHMKWVDGAYWSLWAEVRFYVWAAFVYLVARRNFVKFWLVFQIVVTAVGWLLPVMPHGKTLHTLLDVIAFAPYLPYFTLGVCIYEIYSGGSLHRLAIAGAVLAALIILCDAAFGMDQFAGENPLICVIANLLIFALFLLFVIDHPLVGIFRFPPIVALGQASYSLYLIHQVIGVSILRAGVAWGVPYLVILPLTVAGIVAAALLLFRFVEIPAKSWILRRSRTLVGRMERRMPWTSYHLE